MIGIILLVVLALPALSVAVLVGILRRWRQLVALLMVWVLIFTVLFLVVGISARGEPPMGNTEPVLPLAVGFFYASFIGVVACDVAALVGIPLLFASPARSKT